VQGRGGGPARPAGRVPGARHRRLRASWSDRQKVPECARDAAPALVRPASRRRHPGRRPDLAAWPDLVGPRRARPATKYTRMFWITPPDSLAM